MAALLPSQLSGTLNVLILLIGLPLSVELLQLLHTGERMKAISYLLLNSVGGVLGAASGVWLCSKFKK